MVLRQPAGQIMPGLPTALRTSVSTTSKDLAPHIPIASGTSAAACTSYPAAEKLSRSKERRPCSSSTIRMLGFSIPICRPKETFSSIATKHTRANGAYGLAAQAASRLTVTYGNVALARKLRPASCRTAAASRSSFDTLPAFAPKACRARSFAEKRRRGRNGAIGKWRLSCNGWIGAAYEWRTGVISGGGSIGPI